MTTSTTKRESPLTRIGLIIGMIVPSVLVWFLSPMITHDRFLVFIYYICMSFPYAYVFVISEEFSANRRTIFSNHPYRAMLIITWWPFAAILAVIKLLGFLGKKLALWIQYGTIEE